MSIYRTLKGYSVKKTEDDPDNVKEGQIWYESTEEVIKLAPLIGAWAAGGNLVSGRRNPVTFGIQTAAVVAGGHTPAGDFATSETYDGSSFSEGNNLLVVMDTSASAGTSTAGLVFGGNPGGLTETVSYNGTSYTEENNLNAARYALGGSGTQTAAIAAGGSPQTNTGSALSEEWNGTSWSEGNNLGTGRYKPAQTGTQTATLFVGGDTGPANVANVEEYDGTSWSEVTDFPSTLTFAASSGIQTDALIFLGDTGPGYGVQTFGYDGTNWSTKPNMAVAGGNTEGCGTSTAALAASGGPSSARTAGSEEFTEAVTTRTADLS